MVKNNKKTIKNTTQNKQIKLVEIKPTAQQLIEKRKNEIKKLKKKIAEENKRNMITFCKKINSFFGKEFQKKDYDNLYTFIMHEYVEG